MTDHAIPLRPQDPHHDCELLLPWYATGRLGPSECAKVEAHLAACAQCQAALAQEQALAWHVAGLPAQGALNVERSWSAIQQGLFAHRALSRRRDAVQWLRERYDGLVRAASFHPSPRRSAWMGWVLAAQAMVILVLAGALWRVPQQSRDSYHVLSSDRSIPTADLVVVFRPEMTEASLRRLLRAVHARLVDGPTVTDGYLLYIAPEALPGSVATLHGSPDVMLAEPLDGR